MNVSVPQPALWSRGRMWVYFVVVMAAQIILLVALSDLEPILPRQREPITAFYAVTEAPPGSSVSAVLAIGDPTLFALPHARGFSGLAWLKTAPLQYQPVDWIEPHQWLTQSSARLGGAFEEFLRTNVTVHRSLASRPVARPDQPPVSPLPIWNRSNYRIEGDLAKRELLTTLDVRSISHVDVLTNTVVQVVVNPVGFVFSPVVLSGSGSELADTHALQLVRSARFKPLAQASTQSPAALSWGRIVFQWHTVEVPSTNRVAAQSPP